MPNYLYVLVSETGACKVGRSKDPRARQREVQRSCMGSVPFEKASFVCQLNLGEVNPKEAERYAHWILHGRRINGEWFDVSTSDATQAIHKAYKSVLDGMTAPKGFKSAHPDSISIQMRCAPEDRAALDRVRLSETVDPLKPVGSSEMLRRLIHRADEGGGAKPLVLQSNGTYKAIEPVDISA